MNTNSKIIVENLPEYFLYKQTLHYDRVQHSSDILICCHFDARAVSQDKTAISATVLDEISAISPDLLGRTGCHKRGGHIAQDTGLIF